MHASCEASLTISRLGRRWDGCAAPGLGRYGPVIARCERLSWFHHPQSKGQREGANTDLVAETSRGNRQRMFASTGGTGGPAARDER